MTARNEAKSWGTYNLLYKTGTDKTYAFRYVINGDPKDLTDYDATFTIKVAGRAPIIRTVGNGIAIGDEDGTITVLLSRSAMAGAPVGRHSYYLEIVSDNNEQIPVLDGSFTVVAE